MITDRLRAVARDAAALLDRTEVEGVDPRLAAATVAAVRAGGVGALAAATPYLWEYYREVAATVGTGAWGVPEIAEDSDIWVHVELSRPPIATLGGRPLAPSPCYLSFEGGVSWEPEHGLQLVFDHTGAVCRVGDYSGHPTVAAATGDPACLGDIYG